MNSEIDITGLAREIAMRMAPDALLDAHDVGAMLKCSARYVLEDYSKVPGFPQAIRLTGPDGRKGNARWKRPDIVAWIDSHVQAPVPTPVPKAAPTPRRGGRQRNIPTFLFPPGDTNVPSRT